MAETTVGEEQIQPAILRLLADGRSMTNAQIKHELRKVLPLSADDKARANERPNEEKWEDLVNNALSPSRTSSLIAKGYVETPERGHHRITDAGRTKNEFDVKLEDILSEHLSQILRKHNSFPKQ